MGLVLLEWIFGGGGQKFQTAAAFLPHLMRICMAYVSQLFAMFKAAKRIIMVSDTSLRGMEKECVAVALTQ